MSDVYSAHTGVALSSPTAAVAAATATTTPKSPLARPSKPVIEPVLSLELRLRWLEALLLGVRESKGKGKEREKIPELKKGETLWKLAEDVQKRLHAAVDSNEGLKRFMHNCQFIIIYFLILL